LITNIQRGAIQTIGKGKGKRDEDDPQGVDSFLK